MLRKVPHVFPVIEGPKLEQLSASVKGLEIYLSSEQISCIESAAVYEPALHLDVNTRDYLVHFHSLTWRYREIALSLTCLLTPASR